MQNWKKVLALGCVGGGAALALTGRRNLGIASVVGGLALLATEYPEQLEAIWEKTPEYVHRAGKIFATLSQLSEKFAEEARRRGVLSFDKAM